MPLPRADKNFVANEGTTRGRFDRMQEGDEVSIGIGEQSLHSWIACSAI